MPSTPDRRVKRTQQALQDALVELMLEKGFEATTIADIAERANVGRSTFYAHFADKEALLRESFQGLRRFLVAANVASPRPAVHPALQFALPMLEHVFEARDLFTALVSRRSTAVDLLHVMLVDMVMDELTACSNEVNVPRAAIAEHVVGSFLAVCNWWMTAPSALTATEVDAAFRKLMANLGSANH